MNFVDVPVGSNIEGDFILLSCDVKSGSNGNYLAGELFSGTEKMAYRKWGHLGEAYPTDVVYRIKGEISSWQDKKQVVIKGIRALDRATNPYEDFLPVSPIPPQELFDKCLELIEKISNPELRAAVKGTFLGNSSALLIAPAAKKVHHAFRGGLLMHSHRVTTLALNAAKELDSYVNTDLIIAGGLLHDIGKLQSYTWVGAEIQSTDTEQLVGHIAVGAMYVADWFMEPKSTKLINQLTHIILSHHGTYEFGSPVLPCTIEAQLIHQADQMDAKCQIMREMLDQTSVDRQKTEKNFFLGVPIYRSVKGE